MKRLHMYRGLPGSGKSTHARTTMAANPGAYKRVNKDDIRAMLDNSHWSKHNEAFVLRARDWLIVEALKDGKHVLVDDTNLAPKHEERLRQLARENGAELHIECFAHVSIETCIERDLKRLNSVGEAVIRKMHSDYLRPKPPVIERNANLTDVIICDIDGTVARMNGRSPYDYSQVHTDVPHGPVIAAVTELQRRYRVIFVSGRKAECRESTESWLLKHVGNDRPLFMRADGDDRDDRIVKEEIYRREIEGKYNVLFVLDDRNRVVEMWRSLGLTCFQVAPGDF